MIVHASRFILQLRRPLSVELPRTSRLCEHLLLGLTGSQVRVVDEDVVLVKYLRI